MQITSTMDPKMCQDKYLNGNDIHKNSLSFPIGSTVAVQ